jgi:hypothetical protein
VASKALVSSQFIANPCPTTPSLEGLATAWAPSGRSKGNSCGPKPLREFGALNVHII